MNTLSTPSALRGVFVVLLAGLIAVAVNAQPPVSTQPKKEPDKKDKKEPDKKEPEIKWPTELGGKDIKAITKEMEDSDPIVREYATRLLPGFGPVTQKAPTSKLLIKRMKIETDPTVKIAVYGAIGLCQFENDADHQEALRVLAEVIDLAPDASILRLNAVQTVGMFGPKGSGAITKLSGRAMKDASYETRRAIAITLGRVGFSETTGPNMKALVALADTLAKDQCAAVRTESLQSLVLLGPPWAETRKPEDKHPLKVNTKDAAEIIKYMRLRVGDPKTKPPTPGLEKDRQVEIWCRLVLMRFDVHEVNDENLDAFARYLTGPDLGAKIQALQAIGMMGESASKKLPDVVSVLNEKNQPRPIVVQTINVLVSMGASAKPAIPDLKKMSSSVKAEADKKTKPEQKLEKEADMELVKLIDAAIKLIEEAKPSPSSSSPPPDPKKP